MRNLKALVLIGVLLVFAGAAYAQFAGGSGTEADPWQVATAGQLNNVRNYLGETNSDKYFIQTADIDLGVAPWNQGEGWVPIGNLTAFFYGNYNGNGHIISNLYINRPNSDYQGLFGRMSGSMTNLGVEDVDVRGYNETGGLVGSGGGTISNCYSTGSVSGFDGTGGLVGYSYIGMISNCYSTGTVHGYYRTGGLVGDNRGTISSCYSTGSVSGNGPTGGLVGENWNGIISNCYSTGTVSGNGSTGGLVGSSSGTINNCYSTGAVSGTTGGLVGWSSSGTISNCYWDTQTSGQTTSGGGVGRTTEEMTWPHAAFTFDAWDWRIWKPDLDHSLNGGYPYHRPGEELLTQIPEAAISPFPSNLGTSIPTNSILTWQVGFSQTNSDHPSGFVLYLGTDDPPTNVLNDLDLGYTNSYDPNPDLSVNTMYYWQIVPYNQVGDALNCPVWSFTTYQTTGFAAGSGTESDPWQIANAEHLYNVRNYLGETQSDKYYIQTADIDLGVSPWNEGEGWEPIGTDSNFFYGHYDGDGHVISNLYKTFAHNPQGLVKK